KSWQLKFRSNQTEGLDGGSGETSARLDDVDGGDLSTTHVRGKRMIKVSVVSLPCGLEERRCCQATMRTSCVVPTQKILTDIFKRKHGVVRETASRFDATLESAIPFGANLRRCSS